ncbi:2Fe-2S iron-sulfur cluster-binding protein [Solimonas soli]|uniref:2Fe-2S iron-sulfur cluster-binding protein n=1 Tax=Solimonas soli TaxID=413479 RepID=UPI000A00660E|nr:2Fe-2S iron-sulfur cluster-binding protein [Solimonas soli]
MPYEAPRSADVTFIVDGKSFEADAAEGDSLMEIAVRHDVPGIVGECGGSCACGTCEVVVAESWRTAAGSADDMELAMLEANGAIRDGARLACQIRMSPRLKGIVVSVVSR